MARFDRMLKKVYDRKVQTVEEYMTTLTALEEMRNAIKEGVDHYANQELLNDPGQYWYINARTHYENKLDKLEYAITVLKAKVTAVKGAASVSPQA